ncbi:MAG: cyclase family protein [Deltaproteobacteria bacterium]|nr:cyclase family protein [Deltaproteobacteria bacterium]
MQTLIDISVPITENMAVWPGAPRTEIGFRRSMAKGDKSNNSNLFMNCHTGTHVDAPLHFVADGTAVEQMLLDSMIGEAFVVDLSAHPEIETDDLEKLWPRRPVKRVLLKTRNSALWETRSHEFVSDYCALSQKAAEWFLEKRVALIGIDYLSIQKFGDSPIVHELLLSAGVVILEGINLSDVNQGFYELFCLPLNLVGAEGAPARAVLKYTGEPI